ncbi:MAG: biopolymer transporter ExbD [Thermodesulfobacteriota bacterium]|nr:biopolymer transporter ExbD [Thermodesulfobacteriota bacterium]
MINITAARKAKQKKLEIDIAPLIDMVFILLIFFLVTTSFVKETGVDINRPAAATAVNREDVTILVGVTESNEIFIENREIDFRAVRINVERALAENPEGSVVIVADKESSTGRVIQVMDECKLAGASNVSLAASRPEGMN